METAWKPVEFDRDLIRRYDRPGPRYTSYPTAPHFSEDFGPEDHEALLTASATDGGPLSLYVHLPFCRHRCFFCGCNVIISPNRQRGLDYIPYLEREMARVARLVGADHRPVEQLHWGGGTPTFLPPEGIEELGGALRRHFSIAEGCEMGVEVDPRECTEEHLDALAAAGFNRLSLGVQDLDPKVQQAVNRIQPLEMTVAAIEGARRRGMTSVNLDLIYGLPYQTRESFATTIDEVLALEPDRLAVFNFAYLPAMIPHQRVIEPETMPDGEHKLELLEEVLGRATDAGYVFIGMDHFARPDDSLARAQAEGTLGRNFQGYTTHADADLLAFGVSAISQVGGGYAQNVKELPPYREAVELDRLATCRGLVTSSEDVLRRDVIHDLMCNLRLDKARVEATHGVDFDRHFADALEALAPMAADGLVTLTPERLEVTPLGRLLVRNVAMVFDAYLRRGEGVPYSRTV